MSALLRFPFGDLEIGVGENELRRFASEFQRDGNDVLRSRGLDEGPDAHRACEGDMVDARMTREGCARLFAEPRHDVERARGQPRLCRE